MATSLFLHFRPHIHRRFLLQNATSCVRFSSRSSSNADDNYSDYSQYVASLADTRKRLLSSKPSVQSPQSSPMKSETRLGSEEVARLREAFLKTEKKSGSALNLLAGDFSLHPPERKQVFGPIRGCLLKVKDEEKTKKVADYFSLHPPEIKQKVREMEEKEETESIDERLDNLHEELKDEGKTKKDAGSKFSIFADPDHSSLHPPKEVVAEKNHTSSGEKQKLELKHVREKFTISESDSGSARVLGTMSNGKNYRVWSPVEVEKLVEALVNMVNSGAYKSNSGFKSGYLQHLETFLKKSLPGSGILGKPHIDGKIKLMKRDWQVVYDMLNTSGFGYDKELNCVTTNAPGVWEAYIENHKQAAKWRNKKFPYYEELCFIFGKDRAQGNIAKVESFDDVVLYGDHLKETLVKLSEDIKFELDIKKKALMVPSELSKIINLTQLERFKAIDKFKDNNSKVMTFWTLGEEEREAWVRYLLLE